MSNKPHYELCKKEIMSDQSRVTYPPTVEHIKCRDWPTPCTYCRGYNLESSWCDYCNKTGIAVTKDAADLDIEQGEQL